MNAFRFVSFTRFSSLSSENGMGGRDPRIKLRALELEVFRYFLSFFFFLPPISFFIFFFFSNDEKKKAMDMALNRNLMGKRYV